MRTRMVVVGWLHALAAAFQFLTRLPVPLRFEYTERIFRRSVIFYPLAGAVIGLLLWGAEVVLKHLLPPFPAAVILLAMWVGITGGLHLDGLMDTADGILSHRSREKMLEIMKDSRVGAMGVIVCVLHLLLKLSLLYTLLQADRDASIFVDSSVGNSVSNGISNSVSFVLVIIPCWSRWFMAASIYMWPYARKESGLGGLFQTVRASHVVFSALAALVTNWLFFCA
ncbi:adenosylcobinamide-GDP ribazoletransferase [Paenibacillus hexagrammi]|uniref:adenosylcobinamide-GDP ribazoletransferase n=1 Tax=Paenibacillus hexagrammi TaxID=2908839 RepID=UPI00288309D7|nr:adenosylcobinamide-GDP ribazoletransferase [Paenibacillus sp. YPD9-1]